MKFGKRLGAEASRGWHGTYLDYKACKRAIRQDVDRKDPAGKHFEAVIKLELHKISAFFIEKEEELEAMMNSLAGKDAATLAAFRGEVLELRKYAVLNSTAAIKAVKKRNRHLGAAVGPSLVPVRATDLLSQQHFFTSPKLANLSTQAEILSTEHKGCGDAAKALEDYECPICLGVLQNPVVLSCAHRFCWGCLLSHCATTSEPHSHDHSTDGKHTKPGARLLTAMSDDAAPSSAPVATYPCPVCRKAHPLNLDKLQVDQALTSFIAKLKLRQTTSSVTVQLQVPAGSATKAVPLASETILEPVPMPAIAEEEAAPAPKAAERATEAQVEAEESITCPGAPYLPPQSGNMKGRLTVVLDLDGTLISSFTPRRAPSLAPGSTSYVCGRGAKLNPNGVLVVERPDLGAFLKRLSEFAEVVLFTAGLEDYAAPICDALEKRYGAFTAKLFRPATVHSEVYPCVKDLSLLGRDLARIVLIDDTPLAFLNQPDNGIPIYNFRGDIDDRVLPEAILPLLDQLAAVDDVRPLLHRRFDMPRWLASHGLAPSKTAKTAASPVKRRLRLVPGKPEPEKEREKISDTLILSDFDQTLTDSDAGERLVGELAPELVPMLAALQQPANFVPLTNAVLSEMARRGISEEVLNATLQKMGSEIPSASLKMLQWAAQQTVDFRLISDCNSLFISQILTGARVNLLVKEVITNRSAFVRTAAHDSAVDLTRLDACTGGSGHRDTQESARRLVIEPRHTDAPHGCTICPANLCKGKEVKELRKRADYKRIIYLGDGANDLCPALNLRSGDTVLARKGYPLAKLLTKILENDGRAEDGRRIHARVHMWESHDELLKLVQQTAVPATRS